MSFGVSAYSCFGIAIDRYFAVAYPLKRPFEDKMKNVIAVIWIVAVASSSPCLHFYTTHHVGNLVLWLDGILPLVLDRETTAQEKCYCTIEEIILSKIVPLHRSIAEPHTLAWSLLQIVASPNGQEIRKQELQRKLSGFNDTPDVIAAIIGTLCKLCRSQPQAKTMIDSWCADLLKSCEQTLSGVILEENQVSKVTDEVIVKNLFTVGEVAQLAPGRTTERLFLLVESMLISEASLSTPGTPQSIQKSQLSNTVKAHAFVTLGKLCLQNEHLAKKCTAALARELEVSDDAAIRNNVIVVMCDLCVRYTSLVDRFIPNIATCLRDSAPLVRRQTLTLLTHLLQEDYVKWRGSLFYHFITALVDEDKNIRQFADFCLVHLLLTRHPGMFYQHFVECIFHFNSYDKHKEGILPILFELFQFEKERSPLLKDLLGYLKEVMKDYRNEVKEVLSADNQLANEIEFDLRKFEEEQKELQEQKKRSQQETAMTPGTKSGYQSPRGNQSKFITPPLSSGNGITKTPIPPSSCSRARRTAELPKTPMRSRRHTLATAALINSARKDMNQASRLTNDKRPKSSSHVSNLSCSEPKPNAQPSLISKKGVDDDGEEKQEDVICMPSPDQ
ncbi:condensin-2 complex subunit D3, partial [Exaiptasia diaphana]|uniref:G-protein coupled receptors family 1 profile domain-containing protein n=1 Tax=Exaiptasia diaphana TaxID=2652724 RepID=A0A913YU64_EXADI